ncbi:MAG: DUF4105 domain-containing protein, partial [Bradymonadaceae bacterium]
FWVGDTPVVGTYELYRRQNRGVRIQELNFSPERRLMVAAFLADNVLEEKRNYLYHHYDDNCATRVRDVIDMATDGQFKAASMEPGRMTLRAHTRRHSGKNPPMDALLMFLMNSEIDRPTRIWDEMFLPQELEERVDEFHYVDENGDLIPLVKERTIYFEGNQPPVPEKPRLLWPWALLLSALGGTLAVVIGRWYRADPGQRRRRVVFGLYHTGMGFLMGVPGLILGMMWLFTEHTVTYWNQNLFWSSPVTT